MKRTSKIVSAVLCLLIIFSWLPSPVSVSAATQKPARIINVVYDDSNSMLAGVDTWCQARYAMQVFAAMLEENDTLNIFFMSSYYDGNDRSTPDYTVTGSQSMAERVSIIYNMNATDTGGTPFKAVQRAYEALPTDGTAQNWLVVLTDGNFDDSSEIRNFDINNYYRQYTDAKDLSIVTLAIGKESDVGDSIPDETDNIFVYRATNSEKVTGNIANICNRIFERNLLTTKPKSLDFDGVPMSEIVVFAQGRNVQVGELEGTVKTAVSVQMTKDDLEKSTLNLEYRERNDMSMPVVTELSGIVASYTAADGTCIAPGEYSINITGANDVQIYYKPAIDLVVTLDNGYMPVEQMEEFCEGDYFLNYRIVNPIDQTDINSPLVGDCDVEVTVNGETYENFVSGDRISVGVGSLDIGVEATYLKYNTLSSHLSYEALPQLEPLELSFKAGPSVFNVSELGEPGSVLTLLVKRSGELLTEDQWNSMVLPVVTISSNVQLKVSKGAEVSTYDIRLLPYEDDIFQTDVGSVTLQADAAGMFDGRMSSGTVSTELDINDDLTSAQRFADFLAKHGLKLLFSLIALIIIIGYLPFVKKYLPKNLSRTPRIIKTSTDRGVKTKENGFVHVDKVSLYFPYRDVLATIRFVPADCRLEHGTVSFLKVKAGGGNLMYITNFNDYAGNKSIKFNGAYVPKGQNKPVRLPLSTEIRVSAKGYMISCNLRER